MIKLTARQQEVLDLIRRHINDTGFPPTRADIAKELGFKSPNAAEEHLKALAKKGAIEMIPGASRGIRIPQMEEPGIPIVGKVAAGNPIMSEENIEDRCEIPNSFFHPSADYLLRVQGDSMIDIGIFDGDLLAVHNSQRTPTDGEIVVARVDGEVTVKRFKKGPEAHEVLLIAENQDYSPIEVDLSQQAFSIEGYSVGVIRRDH